MILNWELFEALPGAATTNWERLCGAVIRRNFGSLGTLRAIAQQPGIEFHLHLEQKSNTLGTPGQCWGWQCRWYGIPAGHQIGTNRRAQIVEAIRKTEEHVPGVTDWVLWTRRPLTPTDQNWFYGIESSMRLHLWTEDDLDAHLVGDAEILRRTYFGDLILTPDKLRDLRARSIAPIRARWIPEVHIEVEAEREIRKVLGDPECWPQIGEQVKHLAASIEELTGASGRIQANFRDDMLALVADLKNLQETLKTIACTIAERDLTQTIALVAADWSPRLSRRKGRRFARTLRRSWHPSSLAVQAGLARHNDAKALVTDLRRYLCMNSLAIVGPAGCGKTHLAAELTVESEERPSGIYLEAWPLPRRGTVDSLLPRLRGLQAKAFEEVLEAAEAAGARSGSRIPIVIDGLNESEDPAIWKEELETLRIMLDRFRHVVVIATLRPAVADIALPTKSPKLELPGFSTLTIEAVEKYFAHYKIDPGNLRLPLARFQDPLFLRIFCEATNPNREVPVTPKNVPASLVGAFTRFRDIAVRRIANRPGGVRRYEQDILNALDEIALSLWHSGRRAMPFDEIRELIGDKAEDWTKSLARALRDEGILSAEPDGKGDMRTVFLFDAFGGFLIAHALSRRTDRDQFKAWMATDVTLAKLGTDLDRAHPLAPDIRKALAGLVPRTHGIQFWKLVDGYMQVEALVDAAEVEGQWLDADTVDEIARTALQPSAARARDPFARGRDLFDRFHEVRDAIGHPLNAKFLDRLLYGQSVADRDLRWSEWVRSRENEILVDIGALTEEWRSRMDRTADDQLHALWMKWLLTSTLRDLRDRATCALYWYGRGQPKALFELTLSSLDTNDPYVPERLLAAAYGVVMAAPGEQKTFSGELTSFLDSLWKAFCSDDPTSPTDHWLIREYVGGIVECTRRYYRDLVGEWSGDRRFARPSRPPPIPHDDARNVEKDLVYGFDFRNYTVGRLVPDRHNYQFDHPGYEEVSSWIRGRVWELGWRSEHFSSLERSMRDLRRYHDHRPGRLDAYLKKYGWIGFYEAAGRLEDEGRSPHVSEESRLPDVDIDPSFPATPPTPDLTLPGWLSCAADDLQTWVTEGRVNVTDGLLRPESLQGLDGPWVALFGFLQQDDIESRRRVFGFLHALVVRHSEEQRLTAALQACTNPRMADIPRPPETYYAFAGEMPWSSCARQGMTADALRELYTGTIAGLDSSDIPVEVPAHYYAWESDHTVTNEAGGHPVPAISFAEAFDLRVVPGSLDWCDSEGKRASMTLSAPAGFGGGSLLYFREDLIRQYCDEQDSELIWIVWGKREPWFADPMTEPPEWFLRTYADGSNIWRRVASLKEFTHI